MSSLLAEMLVVNDDAPPGGPTADVDPAAETGRYSEADVLSAAGLVDTSNESLRPSRVSVSAAAIVRLEPADDARRHTFSWVAVGAVMAALVAAAVVVVLAS